MIQFERITIQLISYWKSLFQFHLLIVIDAERENIKLIEIFHHFLQRGKEKGPIMMIEREILDRCLK